MKLAATFLVLAASAHAVDVKKPILPVTGPEIAAPLSSPLSVNPAMGGLVPQLPALAIPAVSAAVPSEAKLEAQVPSAQPALEVRSFAAADTRVEPTGILNRLKRMMSSISVVDSTLRVLYDDNSRDHYYHGTSLAVLEKAADGGGLSAGATFVSDEAGHPYGYARSSARRTGTKGVVLQLEKHHVEPLIKPGHYNPRAPERGEKWEDVPHWFQATAQIPLSAQTPLSKKTILDHLADRRDADPDDSTVHMLIAKLETAFGMQARAAKPVVEDPLGLNGLERKGSVWHKAGKILKRLGQGTIGYVDVHPTRPGLIVKTISPSLDQAFMGLSIEEAIQSDEKAAQVLADAGVGPRVLGARVIDKRRVTVRERILGSTMRELTEQRAFGPEEERLVLDMARRMAAKNVLVSDLKPENIMLGTTERDGERKAYFVDGGMVESFEPDMDEEARFNRVLDYPNVVAMRMDYNTRKMEETYRPLRWFLREALEESSMPRWRLFLKRALNAMMQSGLAAANR